MTWVPWSSHGVTVFLLLFFFIVIPAQAGIHCAAGNLCRRVATHRLHSILYTLYSKHCTLHFAHKFFPCNGAGIRIKFNKIHAENKPPFRFGILYL